jgi:CRISPR-associated endoribonuclease Cas6
MMNKLTLKIQSPGRYTVDKASLFHGALMEMINPKYASMLHVTGLHPYSQHIVTCGETAEWTVCALTEEAKENIIMPLLSDSFEEVHLKHSDLTLPIYSKSLETSSVSSLAKKYMIYSDSRKNFRIRFITPTSFKSKSDGHYMIFPDIKRIFFSLMSRYDAFSETTAVYSDEVLKQFEENMFISGYKLRSVRFPLEGVKIPSFVGEIYVTVKGPQQLADLAKMLVKYGEYSGVGIKTGMGMGAIQLEEVFPKGKLKEPHYTERKA